MGITKGKSAMEPISIGAINEFCRANNISHAEINEVSGYYSPNGLFNAIRKSGGYAKSEAVSSICQFFDLPRNYFDGAHGGTGDVAIVQKPEKKSEALPTFSVISEENAKTLLEYYGDADYTVLFMRLCRDACSRLKREIAEKKYRGMDQEALIAELVRRDLEVGHE